MVFSVSCPECHASFPVDAAKVPDEGIRARCSECEGVFYVQHPAETATAEVEEASIASDARDAVASPVEVESNEAESAASESVEGVIGAETGFDSPDPESTPSDGGAEGEEVAVQAPPAIAFGNADPDARAARLARVLVSDMMTYNPKLYEKAQEQGTLVQDFEEEVKKSWSEYVDQVGEDLARDTPHFRNALNDILAQGDEIFDKSMFE